MVKIGKSPENPWIKNRFKQSIECAISPPPSAPRGDGLGPEK
jgi:hypothetical protein